MTKAERKARQQKLLNHFKKTDRYTEKQVGDKVYVKQWNGSTKRWQVAEYTLQSFERYKAFKGYKKPVVLTQAQRKAKFDETVAYHEAKKLQKQMDDDFQRALDSSF